MAPDDYDPEDYRIGSREDFPGCLDTMLDFAYVILLILLGMLSAAGLSFGMYHFLSRFV